jgi:hypothetical protein
MTSTHRLLNLLRGMAAAMLLWLAACGGGVETGGTGATGTYVEGPITGFGSIVVGGIRFDESAVLIEDVDGGGVVRDPLRLGMVVEVEGSRPIDDGNGGRSAVAKRVRLASRLLGPVQAVGLTGVRIVVLGQIVRIATGTLLDNLPGGIDSLRVGDVVEVNGFLGPDGAVADYVATRVQLRASAPMAYPYRVRGVARDVDSAARTLRVGLDTFDLSAIGLPGGLIDGVSVVRMTMDTSRVNGEWVVRSAVVESRRLDDRDEAEVEGLVTAFTSTTSFSVNGVPVDASVADFPDGPVSPGARVEVEGRLTNGVLVATEVELRSDDEEYNEGIDLRGTLSGLDSVATTFVLRGVTIFYGTVPPPEYVSPASEAGLANLQCVRVRARLDADRTRVLATRIEFRDSCLP